jgi:murein DD-endopeptidase MepM/ murein hydrolase activator NlpD
MVRQLRSLGFCAVTLWSAAASAGPYRLPWPPGVPMELTQDCNDTYYGDHVGTGGQAWDFANGTHFAVSAARAGVVTHVKMSSNAGCNSPICVDEANYVVIDHGDGTASVYLHVDMGSLDGAVRCGGFVRQGQHLATAGSTGWSTGPHLHFQVNAVHDHVDKLCECGADGMACEPDEAAWSAFWSSPAYPSLPVSFDEWPASACNDRRVFLPVSINVDEPPGLRVAKAPKPRPAKTEPTASNLFGIGGRKWPSLIPIDRAHLRSLETQLLSRPAPSAEHRPR